MQFPVSFLYAPDGEPIEEVGRWKVWTVPAVGEVITLNRGGGESAWFVVRVAHHVSEDDHQVDVFVEPSGFHPR